MEQEFKEELVQGILDKFIKGIFVLEYVMNTLMMIEHLLKHHPHDEFLNEGKKNGELIRAALIEEYTNVGKFIHDKVIDKLNQENLTIFLNSSQSLINITQRQGTTVKTDVSIHPTSDKVH